MRNLKIKNVKHSIIGLPIIVLVVVVAFLLFSPKEEFQHFTFDKEGNKKEITEEESKQIQKQEKKDWKESNMKVYYLPKTLKQVSEERDEFLRTYGTFNKLGENYFEDNSIDSWSAVGPLGLYDAAKNVDESGRVISFDMYGDNPNVMFLGGASGGLWRSNDAGISWQIVMDTLACPSVSSIACSQLASDNTVWFSTGARYNGAGIQIGRLYKSTNGGTSWSLITLPLSSGNIIKIEINAFDKNRVFVASENGLFKTTNGGVSFTQVISSAIVSDVITYTNLITPDTSIVLAAIESNGIYRSTNGGNNFSLLSLPSYNTADDNRITLATNPAAPQKTFALVGASNANTFLGIWFSTDKGATWTKKNMPTSDAAQSRLNQGIAVNVNRVFVGYNAGVTFYSSDDGTTWNLSSWTHPDVHKIHAYNTSTIYEVNDGGFYRSTNSGVNWNTSGNKFLQISQSFAITASTSLPNTAWIGTQDNGLAKGYDNLFNWDILACCDAGVYFQFGGYEYMAWEGGSPGDNRLQRRVVGSAGAFLPFAQGIGGGSTVHGQLPPKDFYVEANNFYTHMGSIVYIRSTSASTWSQLGSTPFGSNPVGKLGYVNGFTLAGCEYDNTPPIKRYNPGSNTWETPSITGFPSGAVVTDFDKGSNASNIFCTVSGTSGNRIFKSTNSGATWFSITGNLPNLVNARNLLTNKSNDNIIYIGSDFGVYATGNGGANWYNYSTGLPKVCYIMGLAFENNNSNLYVATYGRGVFKSQVLTSFVNGNNNIPSTFALYQNYPNPFNPATTVSFDLPVSDVVTLQIFDITGRLVKEVMNNKQYNAGSHEIRFNADGLSSGAYFYRITTPKFSDVKKMMLVK